MFARLLHERREGGTDGGMGEGREGGQGGMEGAESHRVTPRAQHAALSQQKCIFFPWQLSSVAAADRCGTQVQREEKKSAKKTRW